MGVNVYIEYDEDGLLPRILMHVDARGGRKILLSLGESAEFWLREHHQSQQY